MSAEQNIPYGYCHCGCGQKTELATKNHTAKGFVKGKPHKYVRGHHLDSARLISNRSCQRLRRPPIKAIFEGKPCIIIFLTKGFVTIIDAHHEDLAQYNWKASICDGLPYAARTADGGHSILLHRIIFGGSDDALTDHHNGFTLDNRDDNLRPATPEQNSQNKQCGKSSRAFRFKGVYPTRNGKRWRSSTGSGYQQQHIGTFDTEEKAARAYDEKARELHGAFARTNF
jgi:AP2 domain